MVMRDYCAYLAGTVLMLPCLAVLSGDMLVGTLSLGYGILLYSSPKFSVGARRFWRTWHRVNFRIINTLR